MYIMSTVKFELVTFLKSPLCFHAFLCIFYMKITAIPMSKYIHYMNDDEWTLYRYPVATCSTLLCFFCFTMHVVQKTLLSRYIVTKAQTFKKYLPSNANYIQYINNKWQSRPCQTQKTFVKGINIFDFCTCKIVLDISRISMMSVPIN